MGVNKSAKKLLDAVTGTGIGKILRVNFGEDITVQVVLTGAPTAALISLEGTIDGINYESLANHDIIADGNMFHIVGKGVALIRPNLTSLSGGTDPTVTLYVGNKQ